MRFHAGQRVRVVGTDYLSSHLQPGAIGSVICTIGDDSYGVRMDIGRSDDPTGEGWCFDEEQLEAIGAEVKA